MSDTSLLAAVQNAARPAWADLTAAGLRQHRPDLVAAIEAERDIGPALAVARGEGAKAEGTRIAGILAKGRLAPGHDVLIGEMITDGATTPDQAASRLLEADAALRAKRMDGLRDADRSLAGITAAPNGAALPTAKFADDEAGWKAEYAADAALRSEFAAEADYLAVRRAERAGKIKVFSPAIAKRA